MCGWRAGDSLDSRGDRWELRQTHERAQILGKSQLFVEILGKLPQAGCPWKAVVNVLKCGRRSWPGAQEPWFGPRGLGQVSATSQPQFPLR